MGIMAYFHIPYYGSCRIYIINRSKDLRLEGMSKAARSKGSFATIAAMS